MKATILTLLLMSSCLSAERQPAPSEELNTLLMHATFRIFGQDKNAPTKTAFGTVFVMGIPLKDDPKTANAVLVTAGHVLDNIGTDEATLTVRRRIGDGTYRPYSHKIQIHAKGQPLYIKHKTADVAAMYVDLPQDVPISGLPPDFLVDDKRLEGIELHPGDEVFCLGFPLLASGPGGFPILRSGRIASYPLTPMKSISQIYFDVFLFDGNSGGPVYYSYTTRFFNGKAHVGQIQGMLGLVIQSTSSALPEHADKSLNLGVLVPAPFIRETIDMLPPKL